MSENRRRQMEKEILFAGLGLALSIGALIIAAIITIVNILM